MYVEQIFRVTFQKHETTFLRSKYYRYEVIDLTGTSGLRSRLHDVEKMNLYLRKNSEIENVLELCDEAILTVKLLQDKSGTITPRDLSRINLIHTIKHAIETKSRNFRCVFLEFQKNLFFSLSKDCYLNLC